MRLVECVPNFSEGRNKKIIEAIAESMSGVDGAKLLDVDPGIATNRTVYTIVGEPEAVLEAVFRGIEKSSQLIDMTVQSGEHPRIGACDVCPFIPVSNMTMSDCVDLAKKLAKRVGGELGIPIYLYAEAAQSSDRKNLEDVRKGEYENLSARMNNGFVPDFGPKTFNAKSGATVIGARKFLIAYNVNLNTRSKKLANEIALNIREAGRLKRDQNGNISKDKDGNSLRQAGIFKQCKAVGWYIDEYKQAQISINLTDYETTSIHAVFDECVSQATKLGLRVTGSEIVGLVPLEPMLQAGRHYLQKQGRSQGVSESELVDIAIKSLGLSDVSEFKPNEKIIEYRLKDQRPKLIEMTVSDFIDELASESAAPGGGSVAALFGATSAALSSMVANLSFEKKGFEGLKEQMNELAILSQQAKKDLLAYVDKDTDAYLGVVDASRLPKTSPEQQEIRNKAILEANKNAAKVPFDVLSSSAKLIAFAENAVENGNPNSLSDASCAAQATIAAANCAYYNVLINLQQIDDSEFCQQMSQEAKNLVEDIRKRAEAVHERTLAKLLP